MDHPHTENLVHRLTTIRDHLEAGMDRREFVRTLVTGGYAIGLAGFLGVDDFLAAGDDEVPIVTALVREDPDDPWSLEERTQYVPAEWYASVEKAIELNELLARTAFTGYLGSAVVPNSYERGTAAVSVGLSSDLESIREAIDGLFNGVSLDLESIIDIEDSRDKPDDIEPRVIDSISNPDIPSGIACETAESIATLAPVMYDPETEQEFFVTAEHAFNDGAEPDSDRLSLPTENDDSVELGTVEYAHPTEDIVAVVPDDRVRPSNVIDADSPVRVRGQLTRMGLADLIARDEDLEKVGAVTGHTSGAIQGFDAVTCFTDNFCRYGQIRWGGEMDLTDGDSGSVSYYHDPDGEDEDVLVAGFNNARTWWPGQSYVWGIGAYTLNETYGYHF
ncbi:hypothetical protein [Natronorubrum daqingense]|uniref:Uncharacterized protein n=1 Tax=Natronorubrum daqingense TaxID=588898 RepID=A0A1N6YNH9_9EURY|nr:hypothetical protein [Natronorubrum daqingense]APX95609.1 hypothetical protein BB347_02700 [Natronorubrum daqingense]SIR16155.1 hypothetical protein SAMN05421809_0506 [Natronorubrum daqingense]